MKVVPEDVSTAPLKGASREPQSTAMKYVQCRKLMTWTIVIIHKLPVQVISIGFQVPLATQLAIAVMTPLDTSYPLLQV